MIKKLFFENAALKVSAMVLAVILWFFVTSRGQTEISLNAPIEYANIPSGIEIAKHSEKTAAVIIRGHESILGNIRAGDVKVKVDARRARVGEMVFQLSDNDVSLPFAAMVLKVKPSSVKVVFEETVSRKVAVRPVVTGNPESGYYLKSVEVAPKEILIEGAKSEVRRTGTVKTEPVDITGLNEDLTQETDIDVSGHDVRPKTDKVVVHISIARRGG